MTATPVDEAAPWSGGGGEPAPSTGAISVPSPRQRITGATLRVDAIVATVTMALLALPTIMVGTTGTVAQNVFGLVVLLAIVGAILVRRAFPVLALLGLTALAAVHVYVDAPLYPVWFGELVVLYSAGRFARWPGRLAAFGLALLGSVLASAWFVEITGVSGIDTAGGTLSVVMLLWIPPMLLFSAAILTGWGVAAVDRGSAATEVAQVSLRRADEQEERAALARDMHDVVAHSLAVVIAQANGARYTQDSTAKDASLEAIAGTAKQALGDVRLLLAQLRHSQAADPVASLAEVPALVERVRPSGLDVRLEELGEPQALPRTADIAAYRILQEALTNALRHGDRQQPVHVRIQRLEAGQGIVIDVHNRMRAMPGAPGHGVRGMHERARLAGGDAWTGIEDGWFRVRAAFPAAAGRSVA